MQVMEYCSFLSISHQQLVLEFHDYFGQMDLILQNVPYELLLECVWESVEEDRPLTSLSREASDHNLLQCTFLALDIDYVPFHPKG